MNTTSESLQRPSAFRTYAGAGAFVLPALALGSFAKLFLLPKVETMWARATLGADIHWPFDLPRLLLHYGHYALIVVLALLVLAELRSERWSHYRKLTTGVFVFAANAAVLIALTALCIAVILAAPGLPK